MSEDKLELNLNDYLDDRMDTSERERFEERLVADEELARQLATEREIRKALRSGDEELSPGFYTRTVARFAAARRRRLPLGVTWSTVGLAAATIAAAAIFIPVVLREELPEMPAAPRTQDEATRLPVDSGTDKGDRPGEDVESSLQSRGSVADDRALAEQDGDEFLVEESIAAPKPKSRNAAEGLPADLDAPAGGFAQEDRKRQRPDRRRRPDGWTQQEYGEEQHRNQDEDERTERAHLFHQRLKARRVAPLRERPGGPEHSDDDRDAGRDVQLLPFCRTVRRHVRG